MASPTNPRWWLSDRDGNLAFVFLPNPALIVWFVAFVVGRVDVLSDDRAETVRHIADGALIVWALDELVRGTSPVRRVLGAVVLAFQLVQLFA